VGDSSPLERFLQFGLPVLVIVCLAWAGLTVFGWVKRRAYNLTRAESAPAKGVTPDFLKVDRAKREAALQRGRVFDAGQAAATAPPALSKASGISRLVALLLAVLSFLAAAAAALQKIGTVQSAYGRLGASWDQFLAIVQHYVVGFVFAAVVILLHLASLMMRIFGENRS
jgi:hypothetical protein